MFLQRVIGREEPRGLGSGGGLYSKRHKLETAFQDGTTSRPSYAYQRTCPPSTSASPSPSAVTTCRRANQSGAAWKSSKRPFSPVSMSPPNSPVYVNGPSATCSALPGKSSVGVFLQNCQASGDFVQLRAEGSSLGSSAASHTPVRLYLTATELVKKMLVSESVKQEQKASRDFTISRYPLQDVRVSASQVSPATLVVSLRRQVISSSEEGDTVTDPQPTQRREGNDTDHVTANCSAASPVHAANRRAGETRPRLRDDEYKLNSGEVGTTTAVVEAYQLQQDSGDSAACVRDWISSIKRNKRKIEMLERLKQTTASAAVPSSSVAEPLSPSHTSSNQSSTVSSPSNTDKSKAMALLSRRRYSREDVVFHRHSGIEFTSSNISRDKPPTSTNGRYTPLHHHYSPHPLSSNSHLQKNDSSAVVRLRQRQSGRKEPFRLLRRLSLGSGTSGSYCFPPSESTAANGKKDGGVEMRSSKGRTNGRTTYMYSLSQDAVSPSGALPGLSLAEKKHEDASPQQQATPSIDENMPSWKNRRSILSRSISENHSMNDRDVVDLGPSTGEVECERVFTAHKVSDPLPVPGANAESPAACHENSSEKDDGVPHELRALQSLLANLTSSPSSPSTVHHQHSTESATQSSHTPSDDDEDDEASFQSFVLRHKQIRGRKVHVSPRAHSTSASTDLFSPPPTWMDRFSVPNTSNSPSVPLQRTSETKMKAGSSATLPQGNKVKTPYSTTTTSASRTSKTLDREGSTSPVPKTNGKSTTTKLFKRFQRHRRWQSSSGVKLELEMIPSSNIDAATNSSTLADLKPPPSATVDKLYLLPAREVAEGLTKMDAELLAHIMPEEIKDGAWMNRQEKEKLAPNILAMVQSFNQLAMLVQTEIVNEKTPQQRAKVISAYIQIAGKCCLLKNFNSLKAILAGLQSTPVYRLRKTWKEIPSKRKRRYNMLCRLMSEENNWQVYRDELDSCLASSVPCIPYLGQFLTQVCHQLSYDKMRAEREEVRLRRRSRSLAGMADKRKISRVRDFRRRSRSFNRTSLVLSGPGDVSTLAASLSTPVSPVESEDETEPSKDDESYKTEEEESIRVVEQVRRNDEEEDSQSLEFSLSLDDHALDMSSSQPHSTSLIPSGPHEDEKDDHHTMPVTRLRKRSSQKVVDTFHSTPVKDANGYIRPLCSPIKLTFDEPSLPGQGYDEPDFVGPENLLENGSAPYENSQLQLGNRSEAEDGMFRIKIPSISLQKTSSHSSLEEEWGTDHTHDHTHQSTAVASKARKMSKSRSCESVVGHERNEATDCELQVNHLTPSHSIPSLDSDSVFSVEEEQIRETEKGREGERDGDAETAGADEEETVEFVHLRLRNLLQDSFEQSIDSEMSTEESSNFLTRTLPLTTTSSVTTPSTTTQDISNKREAMCSPVSMSSELYSHSRDQSFSAIESSSAGNPHDTRDTSLSPVEVPTTEQIVRRDREKEGTQQGRKKTRKANRSKSISGEGTYRHKWRWKKAITSHRNNNRDPTTSENAQQSLNNANPFYLLEVFKARSGDCVSNTSITTNRSDLREILKQLDSNSETRNYELSFEREP